MRESQGDEGALVAEALEKSLLLPTDMVELEKMSGSEVVLNLKKYLGMAIQALFRLGEEVDDHSHALAQERNKFLEAANALKRSEADLKKVTDDLTKMTNARDTAVSDLVVARKQAEDQTNRLQDVEGQLQTANKNITYMKAQLTKVIHEKGVVEYARDEAVRAKDEAKFAKIDAERSVEKAEEDAFAEGVAKTEATLRAQVPAGLIRVSNLWKPHGLHCTVPPLLRRRCCRRRAAAAAAAAGAGAGSLDALSRILADLCTRGNPKEGASLALRKHLEEEARDLSGEAFSRFMDQLYERITSLLESSDVAENLGALRAIDELIDVALGENASKVSKFSSYMRYVFEVKRDPDILILASRVLGHLARAGGAMTADEVERQVNTALDWLRGDRVEYRRFAAVLILKEMAENASTVFNVHVPEFVDAIWVALRDPTLAVRERAVDALRACLKVIEKRETRWRVQWYYRMFEATQDGLGRNAPVHSIHGSLLAVGELLRNTGEFMMSRYREVAEIVLRYLEHRDRLVRLSITSLLPRIAHFLRDRFVTNYLTICMNHILAVLKIPAERASGFTALGEMAGALDGELLLYLPTITSHLREAIAPRRGKPSLEALACVGSIAKAMGTVMEPHVRGLFDVMFSAGLSPTLVEALEQITISIPSLLPTIQDRLLDCISMVLSKSHYLQGRPAVGMGRGNIMNIPLQTSDLSGSALVQLALQTLARFNFKGHDLLEFARESVVLYLDDEDGATRKDAALCCCRLVANSFSGIACTQFAPSRSNRTGGKKRRLVEELVEKLLIAAVADADVSVRHSIFSSLHGNRGFDDFLAQADSLSAVFAALNDEVWFLLLLLLYLSWTY
ncbi:serine/threonine-protein kinase TOR-like [Quercus suber]|uniref:serine/threonine-protein kinase TOR-like n=1 Tax=Quercus suber TaxID=58331 RepID=UPI0032DF4C36